LGAGLVAIAAMLNLPGWRASGQTANSSQQTAACRYESYDAPVPTGIF